MSDKPIDPHSPDWHDGYITGGTEAADEVARLRADFNAEYERADKHFRRVVELKDESESSAP